MENKLKTLKDCYMSDEGNYEQRLREETIKYIKEHEKERKGLNIQIRDTLHKRKDSGKIIRDKELIDLNSWIKHFFNIKDDKLCFQKAKPIRVTLTKKQIKQLEKEKFNDTTI